jgi:hypothetical protein
MWQEPAGIRADRKRLDNARDLSRFRDWDADLDWLIEHERQRGATRLLRLRQFGSPRSGDEALL